jgi:hypothetical protein
MTDDELLDLFDWLVWKVPEDWVPPERPSVSARRRKDWRAVERRWQKNQKTLRRWLRQYGEAAIRERFPGSPRPHFTGDFCYHREVGGCRYYRTSGKRDGSWGADPRLLSSWEWDAFAPQARWPIGEFGIDDVEVKILNAKEVGRRSSIYCTLVDRTTKWGNRFEMAGDESKRDEGSKVFGPEIESAVPEFMRHDPTGGLYYRDESLEFFREFGLVAVDPAEPERPVAPSACRLRSAKAARGATKCQAAAGTR